MSSFFSRKKNQRDVQYLKYDFSSMEVFLRTLGQGSFQPKIYYVPSEQIIKKKM